MQDPARFHLILGCSFGALIFCQGFSNFLGTISYKAAHISITEECSPCSGPTEGIIAIDCSRNLPTNHSKYLIHKRINDILPYSMKPVLQDVVINYSGHSREAQAHQVEENPYAMRYQTVEMSKA